MIKISVARKLFYWCDYVLIVLRRISYEYT